MRNKYCKNTNLMVIFLLTFLLVGCKKYLDAIPSKSLVIPSTLGDLQSLLDNNGVMNTFIMGEGEVSADNYYLTYNDWTSLDDGDRNAYIWGNELFFDDANQNEWFWLYRPVYYANVVLEDLQKMQRDENNQAAYDNIKGSALFYRAYSFYFLVTTYAKAYDSATSSSDPGIPLRLTSDFNKTSVRSSVQKCYQQIIGDVIESVPLLAVTPVTVMRPSRPAAYGLLARTYLAMRAYKKAGLYADSCLLLKNDLMDYNQSPGITGPNANPFNAFNPEVIYDSHGGIVPLESQYAKVDSTLYDSYEPDDLRKELFFTSNGDGSYAFVGNYFDQNTLFFGLATDEMYLTRAECFAREGNTQAALNDLNTLLSKRWETGTFIPFTAGNAQDALTLILRERRKELLFRDLRWMDIKRLNKEGANITLKRILNGQTYTLPPNDNRFALPLPANVIRLTGMQQNPR